MVALEWVTAPSLTHELSEIRDALANAAKALWPNWYITAEKRFEQTRSSKATLKKVIAESKEVSRGASSSWLKVAWRKCQTGELPLVAGMAMAEQVHQLALALDPNRLVFALSVASGEASPARVKALAKATEWLAHESHARTLLLVPAAWQGHGELDHVNYGAIHWPKDEPSSVTAEVEWSRSRGTGAPAVRDSENSGFRPTPLQVNVGPIVGRPHPGSEVERVLFECIMNDSELAPLFAYNQRLAAFGGKHYIVDLVWQDGGLVVEIDGPEHHGQQAHIRDKDRDYRLYLSGYVTLRIANAEVQVAEEQVLAKIRNMVRRQQALGLAKIARAEGQALGCS